MPDYSACGEGACPKKNACARYRMVRGTRQSVVVPDKNELGDKCNIFWDVRSSVPFHLKPTESPDSSAG